MKNKDLDLHKTLLLVDGSAYLFRAFHALPELTNAAGEATGALYGVLSMLRKLCAELPTAYMGMVFDPPGPTHRHKIYPKYKAQRGAMPAVLQAQIAPLHQLIETLGLPLIMLPGVEADDVLATLARQAQQRGLHTVIVSSDKDLAQLVSADITLYNAQRSEWLDPAGVLTKYQVKPEQMVDYLALMGDAADNIPGVPGVGPKTAIKWLHEYHNIDNLIDNAQAIKGKVGERLRAHIEGLRLSQCLVRLDEDCDVPTAPEALIPKPADTQALRRAYQRYEFKSWLAALEDEDATLEQAIVNEAQLLDSPAALQAWCQQLAAAEQFVLLPCLDRPARAMDAVIIGLAMAIDTSVLAYVPLTKTDAEHKTQGLPWAEVQAALKPILADTRKTWIGHDLKEALGIFGGVGLVPAVQLHDVRLVAHVLDSAERDLSLPALGLRYLQRTVRDHASVAGRGAAQQALSALPLQAVMANAVRHAQLCWDVADHLKTRWPVDSAVQRVLTEVEWPLLPILSAMEGQGVLLDVPALLAQSADLATRIAALEAEAHTLAGRTFNLASTKQLREILFAELGLPVQKKTPKGLPSTAEEVLTALSVHYPLPKLILTHRTLSKLKSTYTDALPAQVHPRTGRVHTHYDQAGTVTGRFSSAQPNLQNIPVRTPEGRQIRRAFIAPPGYQIVSADYSQIELRILAHFSQDARLIAAFQAGQDIHKATAAELWSTTIDAVTPLQRRRAKAVNFGLLYGISAFGLAKQLQITRPEAQAYMDGYFERYPQVAAYLEGLRAQARARGYVQTLLGRQLALPDSQSNNALRRQAAERAAINAPMQGTAADLIKLAMIAVSAWLRDSGCPAVLTMQVHDELVFEVAQASVQDAIAQIRQQMTTVAELAVPLVVDVGVGSNWEAAH